MFKKFVGFNALASLIKLFKTDSANKVDIASIYKDDTFAADKPKNGVAGVSLAESINTKLETASTALDALATKVDTLQTSIEGSGAGDMMKITYDTDNDGVIDNAKALNGHADTYFATSESLTALIDSKGVASGIAPLDESGLISSSYLPSYVDDVIEGYISDDLATFYTDAEKTEAVIPEKGKIYIDVTNYTYRWTGTKYAIISSNDLVEMTEDEITTLWESITPAVKPGTIITATGAGDTPAAATVGDTVQIGDIQYVIVNVTDTLVNVIMKYCDTSENTKFNPSAGQTTYNGSTIHEKCKQFYANKIPEEYKTSGILLTTTEAIDCPVFIPTLAQVASTTKDSDGYYHGSGEWSYFADDTSRVFKNESTSTQTWWLQSQWPDSPSSSVCCVGTDGSVGNYNPRSTGGFRPALAISRSAFA